MSDPTIAAPDVLAAIRGKLPPARANARSVAALTDNPGCRRRRIIDAARVRGYELASQLGFPVTRGQSPFAISGGNQFEWKLKEGSGYAELVEALKPLISLPSKPKVVDLGKAKGVPPGEAALRVRAAATEKVLATIARGDESAPHIVDHPVLIFDIGGTSVFLEPDALAFRVGKDLELVEIKSFPIIDGQADPSKLAATGGQAAVYLLALRAALDRLGFQSVILRPSVILVAPRNFGRKPTAHRVPLRKKMMALARVLGSLPRVGTVLEELRLPAGFTLDIDSNRGNAAVRQLEQAVRCLPMSYVPECLSACDLAKYCRHQARMDDCPSRIGRLARDNLAGVSRLNDALRLATDGPRASERQLSDVAAALKISYDALRRARAQVSAL